MSSTISLHFDNYTKQAVTTALTRHYGKERARRNHSNQSIDTSKTHRNIIFVEAEEGMRQKALNRIAVEKERNPKLRIRKDSKILITTSVNIGGDLARESEEKKLEFLHEAYAYLRDRFGGENGENIVNAEIHLDETNPHLHFNFVPIFEINGSTRLNSDPVMKRDNKKAEHVAIRNHMNSIADGRWLFERKKDAGPSGLSLEELKTLTAVVEQEVDKQVGEAKDELIYRTMDVVNREKSAEVMLKDATEDKAKAREMQAKAVEMQEQVALQIQQLNEYARTVREREVRIKAREEDIEQRETLLESATRALSDFKRKVGEFTQNVRNAFRWAENRKSEDDKQKVSSINAKFEEKVIEPTRHIFEEREIDPTTLIDDLKQPIIDANDLISDLEVYQPSALER